MLKRLLLSLLPVLALAFVLVGAAVASTDVECSGALGAVTVDSVLVPEGATCTLDGTRVRQNITVLSGASLTANAVRAGGNIQADGAEAIAINAGSVVRQSVDIKQGNTAQIDQALIRGTLKLEQNQGAVSVTNNRVGQNLRADQNTGGVTISDNIIGRELRCRDNEPPPVGGGNSAPIKRDQCAGL
ncbi:MAG: hypothetical protein ACRDIB_10215 [Ardenticatenaceae bacterium]